MAASNNIRTILSIPLILGLSGCNTLLTQSSDPQESTTHVEQQEPYKRPLEQRLASESTLSDDELTLNHKKASQPVVTEEKTPVIEEPDNVWLIVQQGFSLTIPDNERIERQVKWFARHKKHLAALQERAKPYLHYIVEEINKRDMPTELALLPAIESAYRPFAYSSGRAAGLWQFIPSTGKLYGLNQNWWYDG
ncbi:MAG: transglycosylase SLT domain-containing protein, partial [Chromatiales bacterium]|nr:transglycosylase SLT domain-containing protein [Chromatiales bacterium]